MEYTIEKLLAEKQWKQLNLLEGKESCKRKIEGIRIIEVPEMARYLTGGTASDQPVCIQRLQCGGILSVSDRF